MISWHVLFAERVCGLCSPSSAGYQVEVERFCWVCSAPATSAASMAATLPDKPMASTRDDKPPETALPDPHLWRISSVAVIGSFLAQMDATVVNVSLSSLALELHTSLSNIQWVTSGYLLAAAFTLPLSGWLVDRMGTKAVYLW